MKTLRDILEECLKDLFQQGNCMTRSEQNELIDFLLNHSSLRVDSLGFSLTSYSIFGCKEHENKELSINSRFLIFKMSRCNPIKSVEMLEKSDWSLASQETIETLEFIIAMSDEDEYVAVYDTDTDKVIKYSLIVSSAWGNDIFWELPIVRITSVFKNVKSADYIHNRHGVEVKIKELVHAGASKIEVFDMIKNEEVMYHVRALVQKSGGITQDDDKLWVYIGSNNNFGLENTSGERLWASWDETVESDEYDE